MPSYSDIIDLHYPAGATPQSEEGRLRALYLGHCRAVASLALALARSSGAAVNPPLVEHCAMLHDIGIRLCHAPSIHCHGDAPYILHGIKGAALLRSLYGEEEEAAARVCERHTGAGITAAEVASQGLPLPAGRDFLPQTTTERLICYADKFFSKSRPEKQLSYAEAESAMARFGVPSLERFRALAREFGVPGLPGES